MMRDLFTRDPRLHAVLEFAEGWAADNLRTMAETPLRWMWGEALLVFSMAEFGAALSPEAPRASPCFAFAERACDAWACQARRVDQSDTAAPALALWAVQSRSGGHVYDSLISQALSYIAEEPRIYGDIPNHLGHSPEGRLYPRSAWVDSLMMLGLFPALYAAASGDEALLDRAARLPAQFAELLQDPDTKLWRHAWWAGAKRAPGTILIPRGPFPTKPIFWARGNGWVISSLSLLLDSLPPAHPESPAILKIFRESSTALLERQRPDGWFPTLLGEPSYRESSATLLVAHGWLRGVGRGWLDPSFLEPAIRAFGSVVDSMKPRRPGSPPSLGEISGPTIPLPIFPRLGYTLVPRGDNRAYGIAALLLAALARAQAVSVLDSRPRPDQAAFVKKPGCFI